MTRSATVLWSCASAGALLALLASAPAAAQRDVTDETVTAGDVAMTPLEDLNIEKDPIPPALLRAMAAPYRNPGLDHCAEIRSEIGDLDAVLGDDFDTASLGERDAMSAGKLAQRVLSMLIPYRGVIRELSGANRHAWEFQQAIAAGMMRRAYLKGLGQAMDCPYPARPATPEMIAATILPPVVEEEEQEEDAGETQGRPVPVEEE